MAPLLSADSHRAQTRYSAAEFFKTITLLGASVNYNANSVLVTHDGDGVYNLYRYPFGGGDAEQLTRSNSEPIIGIGYFPLDDRILYTADQGGNERHHLYVRELDGSITDLTPVNRVKAVFLCWQQDHSSFFILSNERDEKTFDVYRYDTADYSRTRVYENSRNFNIGVISPNGRWLTLTQETSNADSNIYLVDLHSKQQIPNLLTPHQGDVQHHSYTFTPNSKHLIYATDEYGEFTQAWRISLETGHKSVFFRSDWDVEAINFSRDGKYYLATVNDDGTLKVSITESASGQALNLPPLPEGELAGIHFSADSRKMVFALYSDTSPANLYSYEIGTPAALCLLNSLNPAISKKHLVTSQVKRFNSFDGLEVPGNLFKPKAVNNNQKVPALIWIHGGPGGQFRQGYKAELQHLVNHGYAVFGVNNRGSGGYGKTFFHLDDKRHGEDDLQDIVYSKKYLQSLPWIDPNRIGVIGQSYGGYLTIAALTFTDEFKAGIDIFGVTNWTRTLTAIPPWWEASKKALYDEMGDPATDAKRHHAISPLFHAHRISRPVLVVQGANDPRVLQIESDELVAAIRKNKVPVEYLLFADEGHGFKNKNNRIRAAESYLSFLKKYL